ncbi:hypothetical protein RN001_010928 [Aquatica leii]|uniref:Uncharacterized protein n=1 Tax=Aquatica leii TaxID=1421715 RepID=A0AAN7PWY2_9COLE|nr:hypothetical protein RN001_010928 [Aquatica leii]
MEEAVGNLEKQMQKADEKLDSLTMQVIHVEHEILNDDGTEVEVNNLLKSVTDVKNDYQNLRKEVSEVQDLQKQVHLIRKQTLQV